jgi:hypothetical protein
VVETANVLCPKMEKAGDKLTTIRGMRNRQCNWSPRL